ncbi:nuclease-related domain-containing protein [uncultured Marinobacter sp.]|uniref:nuclease-related domain-containing protein n=1 Tax=uncultured Marinobacter sp. TaxID=187379 RepID=UPI00258E49B6|nr:nuclease-related domain-containing protein [uncultured Marinobacter sp.]
MDYTQILHTLQNAIPTSIWYLIPLFILAMVIKSSWFKGKAGEAVVNLSAKLFLDKTRYHLIKNVTLPTEDGTTQIDHIIVLRYGLGAFSTGKLGKKAIGRPWYTVMDNAVEAQKIGRGTKDLFNSTAVM